MQSLTPLSSSLQVGFATARRAEVSLVDDVPGHRERLLPVASIDAAEPMLAGVTWHAGPAQGGVDATRLESRAATNSDDGEGF